ncbi:MAG: methyltransferase domain-containing protein [Chloroflexi bacterium]|nr:methyltransferase domain-containing protein [Chloroflexota bacterium]
MKPQDKYYNRYGITHPAYNVSRIAGAHIRDRASCYFSGRMLEIGCGTKIKGLLVGEFVDEHIGLDHAECPHDHSNIDIFGTAYEIPVDDSSYDCVLSTAVMEHLEEPQKAICEAFRVLNSGGYGIYTMPLFWHLHEEPRDFFRYTKYGLQYLFEKAGFDIVELTPLSGYWVMSSTEWNYYLKKFRRSLLKYFVDGVIMFNNWFFPKLDKGVLRDERFTWMYLVVIRKPECEQ